MAPGKSPRETPPSNFYACLFSEYDLNQSINCKSPKGFAPPKAAQPLKAIFSSNDMIKGTAPSCYNTEKEQHGPRNPESTPQKQYARTVKPASVFPVPDSSSSFVFPFCQKKDQCSNIFNVKTSPKALDLFCGKGSISKVLSKNGYEVVTLDINPNFNPTHTVNILDWDYWKYPKKYFEVISASVPCTEYSRAKTLGTRDFDTADKLVRKTLEIIEYFQPKLWWIENPRTGFLPTRPCIQNFPYLDVDYCQFSNWGYQKPTRIWGSENLANLPSKVCDGKNCQNLISGKGSRKRHKEQLGGYGMKFSTYHKWKVPEKLVEYLLTALKDPEEKFSFKREDYAVRNHFVKRIEEFFGTKADRDCFATKRNSVCASFFTENEDAFKQHWDWGETIWLNPPWSLWNRVAKKLRKSTCTAICILPDWQRGWVKELLRKASKRMYFKEGTQLFEVNGHPVGGIRWGVWALLIEGKPPRDKTRLFRNNMLRQKSSAATLKKAARLKQLILNTQVQLLNGEERFLKILVDTGAEINLIKKNLIPEHLFYLVKKPLKFQTANGQILAGGTKCTKLTLQLQLERNDALTIEKVEYEAEFYEAQIQADAILSYPWLAQTKLGIFPHHHALVLDNPELSFLYGLRDPDKRKENDFNRNSLVNDVSALHLQKYDFSLPLDDFDQRVEFLNNEDLEILAENLGQEESPLYQVNRMIISRENDISNNEEYKEKISKLRESAFEEFNGTVFRSSVFPNPPVRGLYGYAYIPLKEGARPTRQKPFFLQGERKEALEKITQDWIDMKFIEPATTKNSEWLSQTFPVPKKSPDFPWRGVVDMRGPNSQTRRCNYPLPKIEDILVKHGANEIFSILDLKQAFHQQPLHPESRPITCSFTPKGIFQWRVNVMGLTNASQQFQQMMDDRLAPVRDIATPYVDDILIGTTVGEGEDLLEAHNRDLRRVLKILEEEKLVVDPKKAQLFVDEVEFCGQILGNGTRRPAPGKLMAIEKWEVPTTITALRAFLGFICTPKLLLGCKIS